MPEETQSNPSQNKASENQKVVEKYYIEVNPSGFRKFLHGLLGGLGWGVGITLGTSLLLLVIGYVVSRIDFVPILGQFLSDVVKSASKDLK